MDIVNKVYGLVVSESTVMMESDWFYSRYWNLYISWLYKKRYKTCILIYVRNCIYYVKHSTTSDQCVRDRFVWDFIAIINLPRR